MRLPVASTLVILNQPPFVAPKMYMLALSVYGTWTCVVFSFVTNVPELTQFPGAVLGVAVLGTTVEGVAVEGVAVGAGVGEGVGAGVGAGVGEGVGLDKNKHATNAQEFPFLGHVASNHPGARLPVCMRVRFGTQARATLRALSQRCVRSVCARV